VWGPCIGRDAGDDEAGEVGQVELIGRPVVEQAKAWLDHREVEHAAEPVLEREVVLLELAVGGVVVREDASHAEEDADRGAARVCEDRAARSDPAQGEPRGGDERMRVEDAEEDDVEEEALDPVLPVGEVPVVEVGGDDARVVRAVPGLRGRLLDERRPEGDRGSRRLAAEAWPSSS
jgi:hypothetical protein